jgi:two-component system, NtrC family, response regulator AtoC
MPPQAAGVLRLLVVEEDGLEAGLLKASLGRGGRLHVELASSAKEAAAAIACWVPDVVLADVTLPDRRGIDLVREVRVFHPTLPVLLMAREASVDLVVEGMRAGATEFLQKPLNVEAVLALLDRAVRERPLRQAAEERGAASPARLLTGTHPRLDSLREFARHLAALPCARILITGESGTGKSLLARVIHELGSSRGRFIDVNCAALPPALLETELFGHEKGAFTDARSARSGLVEMADRGTLFLDEIGTLPLELQGKLLTFLDGRGFRRVGGTEDVVVNTRIITATNENLPARVRERSFREDLFYRLDVASVEVPPLREMPGIVPELAERFVADVAEGFARAVPPIDASCMPALQAYHWPGNVRELRNTVERALIFHGAGALKLLPPATPARAESSATAAGVLLPNGMSLDEVERHYLEATLNEMDGAPLADVAARLGISRKTLWDKRRRYGI